MKNRILVVASLLFIAGCNTEKRASRLIDKADRLDNTVLPKVCASRFPPVESFRETIKYKPGVPIPGATKYVQVNCDSLLSLQRNGQNAPSGKKGTFTLPCPPCDSLRVDTSEIIRHQTEVNRAKEKQQEQDIMQFIARIAKLNNQLATAYWILGILGAYTVLRWILRYWNIKLP